MSLIEQAAKRLEQLRQAGAELPDGDALNTPECESAPTHLSQPVAQSVAPLANRPVVQSSKQIEINLEGIATAGLLSPQASRSLAAEEYRVIKRPIIANAMSKGGTPIKGANLVMVTSALPGEGKTFSAINLAISIAMELDNTVMLVDADVARPSVLNMLGLPPAPGLLDVVSKNSVDISDVLLRTNIEKLSILPSGTQSSKATELLASDAMMRLLDDMSSRYDDRIIIFDSPPLLLTTESRALASHMGQIIVVVNAETTLQSAVTEAIATIEACPVKMLLLNQARTASAKGYGYGYGYGNPA